MSFDLNLPTTCDHLISRELNELDADRVSIRVLKPIAAASSVKLYASGDPVPGSKYNIVYDPLTIKVNQPRMIQFKEKWQSIEDYFEVTYVTLRTNCPKCVGLEAIDDITYNVRGDLFVARDEKLLLQNLEKFTITELASNPFHTFIGTSLVALIGEKISDIDFIRTKIIQEINTTLEKFKDLQSQYKSTGRTVTNGETLRTIENIDVVSDEFDPTILRATITVTSGNGKMVEFAQDLKIVEP